ncbi:factor 16 [Sparganum proliferum]
MAPNDKQTPMNDQSADPFGEPVLHGCTVRYFLLAAGIMHSAMATVFAKMSEDSLRLVSSTASKPVGTESEACGETTRPDVQSEAVDLSVKRKPQDRDCIEQIRPAVPSHVLPPPPCVSPSSVSFAGSTTTIKNSEESNSHCEKMGFSVPQIQGQPQSKFFPIVPGYGPRLHQLVARRPLFMPANGGEEYACKVPGCEKKFRSHNSLVNHHRTHTGERPFVCDFPGCWQAFARQSNLITHRLVHLDREMRRKFICPVGGCGRNFLKKTNLEDHLNLHLGQRPYKCEHPGCGKAFRCRSNLSGHRRVHMRANEAGQSTQSSALEKRIEMILARAADCPNAQQSPF